MVEKVLIMGMNIKDEETHQLARRLATVTGETVTAAVKQSLRERLDRLSTKRKKSEDDDRLDRILKIAREAAPLWKEPYKSMDHGDLLYDEQGLPK